MRFMIMHKTIDRWERGESPTPEECARVAAMMGDVAKSGRLLDGAGLRASSLGVRLNFSGGERTITPGPFVRRNELPAGFAILEVPSMDEAIDWASRFAQVRGDGEIDLRPVTEAWDIGLAPKPEVLETQRIMALYKADAESESGRPLPPRKAAQLSKFLAESKESGRLLLAENMQPSAKGARLKMEGKRVTIVDGPFSETKELIAGYVIVKADAKQQAVDLALRYGGVVESPEIDVRELEEP